VIKYQKKCFFLFLWLVTIASYIIVGTEFFSNVLAETAIWNISATYLKQFNSPIPIGENSIIPYKINMAASGRVKITEPEGASSVVDILNIESNGFSRVFALNEVGQYNVEESYTLTISSPALGESKNFSNNVKWSYYNSTPALTEFRLEDMYIDNYTYSILPSDTLDIVSITPAIGRPGDDGEIKIKTLRTIKKGEIVSVSITINSQWHKISSIIPSSIQGIIQLKAGWNLISFPVAKCFYEGVYPDDQPRCIQPVNIKDLGFNTLAEWFSSVLKPNNSWSMVIGQNGAMNSSLPGQFNTLKYMSPSSGYWVKIKAGTINATLSINGQIFDTECSIPLMEGWNLVGYPTTVGYYDTTHPDIPWVTEWVKVEKPIMAHILESISGIYSQVIGEHGAYDPSLPLEFSSMNYIAPGLAYWVKMKEARDLIYPSGEAGKTVSVVHVRH